MQHVLSTLYAFGDVRQEHHSLYARQTSKICIFETFAMNRRQHQAAAPQKPKRGTERRTYKPTTYSAKEAGGGDEMRGNMQACAAWDAWHTVSNPSGLKGEQPSSLSLASSFNISLSYPILPPARPPLDDFYDPRAAAMLQSSRCHQDHDEVQALPTERRQRVLRQSLAQLQIIFFILELFGNFTKDIAVPRPFNRKK